jgi:hypothetical protein
MTPSGMKKPRPILSTRSAVMTIALVVVAIAGAMGTPVGLHW